MNLTDVDDKTIRDSQAQGLPPELKVAAESLTLRQLMLADAPTPAASGAPPRPARGVKHSGPLASIGQIDVAVEPAR